MNFEFQLVLTEKCNLRCTYCYMKKNPKDMTRAIFHKHYDMLPHMMKKYNKTTYTAALFGGEPLLNWDLIEYITPILNNDPKCKHIIIMSNCIELQDAHKRKFLEDNRIAISMSFDGLWNETNRPLPGGKSSLPIYMTEPLKSYFTGKGSCKVMVAPSSVPTMVKNFIWFVEEYGMPSPDFTLVRDDVWTKEDVQLFAIETEKLANVIIEYFNKGKNVMAGFFLLYILDLMFGESYGKRPHGCFAGCHGAGFMPDGKIYPCARFGSNEKFPIADSIEKTIYSTCDKMKISQFYNPATFTKCQECVLNKYCNAGCSFQQLKPGGKEFESAPVDSICELLKICYSQSMRITRELKDNKLFVEMIKNSIKNVG